MHDFEAVGDSLTDNWVGLTTLDGLFILAI
jgi:hypothetical protein